MNPTTTKIYNNLLKYFETHVTLNNAVPAEVGCAEAVSFILQKSDITGIPAQGIASTFNLMEWLLENPNFNVLQEPQEGAILVSATGTGNGTVEGHTGVFGAFGKVFDNEWGIVSNDSNSGLLLELWNWKNWQKYYVQKGGLRTLIFLAK